MCARHCTRQQPTDRFCPQGGGSKRQRTAAQRQCIRGCNKFPVPTEGGLPWSAFTPNRSSQQRIKAKVAFGR
jgi:hypothetical protein